MKVGFKEVDDCYIEEAWKILNKYKSEYRRQYVDD